MKKMLGFTFILSLFFLIACNGGVDYGDFPETIEFIIEQAEAEIERGIIPGISVAFVDLNTGFTWTQGFGYADASEDIPVTNETMFNIDRISQIFTAVAVMQLVEQGLIDLDEPIVTYLPEFNTLDRNYQNVTTRMLLNHTSGAEWPPTWLFETINIMELPTALNASDFVYLINYLEFYYEDIILFHSLNQQNPAYMNNFLSALSEYYIFPEADPRLSFSPIITGYTILGILLAAVMNQTNYFYGFADYMNEFIFAPAQMSQSTFIMTEELVPYMAMPAGGEEVVFANILPAASMFTTAEDMAEFMHLILDGGGILLGEAYLNQMFDVAENEVDRTFGIYGSHTMVGYNHIDRGFGFDFLGNDMVGQSFGFHNFSFQYSSAMYLNLEEGMGVFITMNSERVGGLNLLPSTILRTAIEERQGRNE